MAETTSNEKFLQGVKEKREYDLKFFKLSVEVLKGMEAGELDPFVIMETEFLKQEKKGIKPVVIIDELHPGRTFKGYGKEQYFVL